MIIQRLDRTKEKIIAISQPAHSWLSGQLARNWGNKDFAAFAPLEDVCYAAELHDIGYLDSEQNATLNPATGLPLTFYELPALQRLKVWQAGIYQMRRVSSYAAVLMSTHYCGLSEKYPERRPADRELMRKFREEQQEFRRELLQNLAGKNDFSDAIGESTLRYNSRLLAAWDLISLHLCMNPGESFQVPDVPSSKTAAGELRLAAQKGDRWRFALSPWPFSLNELRLRYEGSILQGKFSAEDKLRQALDRAESALIEVELVPACPPA
jgi:hypothetical protein